MTAADGETMFTIGRVDGQKMYDEEYDWMGADSLDDFSRVENEADEPTEYVVTEWRKVAENRRVVEPDADHRATSGMPWPARWLTDGEQP